MIHAPECGYLFLWLPQWSPPALGCMTFGSSQQQHVVASHKLALEKPGKAAVMSLQSGTLPLRSSGQIFSHAFQNKEKNLIFPPVEKLFKILTYRLHSYSNVKFSFKLFKCRPARIEMGVLPRNFIEVNMKNNVVNNTQQCIPGPVTVTLKFWAWPMEDMSPLDCSRDRTQRQYH